VRLPVPLRAVACQPLVRPAAACLARCLPLELWERDVEAPPVLRRLKLPVEADPPRRALRPPRGRRAGAPGRRS
ncbi:MAG TPA: hypothetical protein VHJ78_03645, partial [Actinomycetota bacterium]|nr:hypothetical protein [Actinomycetota bacterium]